MVKTDLPSNTRPATPLLGRKQASFGRELLAIHSGTFLNTLTINLQWWSFPLPNILQLRIRWGGYLCDPTEGGRLAVLRRTGASKKIQLFSSKFDVPRSVQLLVRPFFHSTPNKSKSERTGRTVWQVIPAAKERESEDFRVYIRAQMKNERTRKLLRYSPDNYSMTRETFSPISHK